jgi:tetratricopeptide (TPR) repeat protein
VRITIEAPRADDGRRSESILADAETAYKGVLVDMQSHRAAAAEVVTRARASGSTEALVVALRAVAWAEHVRLNNEGAKALLDQAARLAARHRLDRRLGDVLVSRAAVCHELGRLRAAQDDLDRAGPLIGPENGVEVVFQQAALHQNIGRLFEAARLYRHVVSRPACPLDVLVKATNNLALVEVQLGRWQAGRVLIDRAAELSTGLGPAPVAIVAQSRAWVTMQMGRLAESLRQFEQAGVLYEQAGLPLGEHYLEYADALMDLRLLPEARSAATSAAEQFTSHDAKLMAAEAELRAARLGLLAGDGEKAVTAARVAVGALRRQGRTAWVARAEIVLAEALSLHGPARAGALRRARDAAATLERLGLCSDAVEGYLAAGRLALARGRTDEALRSLSRADLLSRRAPVLVRLRGRLAAALAGQAIDDPAATLRHCRAGLADLARHRAALPSMELRALASGHGAELGQLGLRAVLPTGSPARVLDWMDRTRAAALVTVDVPSTEHIATELATLRSTQTELEESRRVSGREPAHLLAQVAAAESSIRRKSWTGELSRQGTSGRSRPAQLRAALNGQILVMYGSLDGRLTAAVLEPRWMRLVSVGATADVARQSEMLLFALRRLAAPRTPASAAAARTSADAALPPSPTDSSGRSASVLTSPWSSSRAPSCPASRGRPCTPARPPSRRPQRSGLAPHTACRRAPPLLSWPAPDYRAVRPKWTRCAACTPRLRSCCPRTAPSRR